MPTNNKKIIVITGPTASGKSDVTNLLASRINGEVVSADSMQIYKGMDIGTGKIAPQDKLVKHWGIDIVKPDKNYSVALFQDYARKCFDDIENRDKTPVLCGGTGFYIRGAIDDYEFLEGEQKNNPIRDKYNKYLDEHGALELWLLLKDKDSASANIVHPNNSVRVIRALEMFESGNSYAEQVNKLQNIKQKYDAVFFGLDVDPKILVDRINTRVDKMIELGLVDEVKTLLDKGYRQSLTATNAIGYKEIVEYIENKCSLDEAIEQIKSSTRHYAKRQRTWFRKDKRIQWIEYNKVDVESAVKKIILCCDKDQ